MFNTEYCTWTTKDLSKMFNVTEETIRRWTRTERIIGSWTSKKDGFVYTGDAIMLFSEQNPKYRLDKKTEEEIRFRSRLYVSRYIELEKEVEKLRREIREIKKIIG